MKELTLGTLGELEKVLKKSTVRSLDVPSNIRIPYWPECAAPATIRLGRKEYQFPVISPASGLIRMEKRVHIIEFNVYSDGAFGFSIMAAGKPIRSDGMSKIERIQAIFLFRQFKREICDALAKAIDRDVSEHNEAAAEIEEAMATFLPYLFADAFNGED